MEHTTLTAKEISEKTKNFIFEHIDSAELLEILLIFYADQNKKWTCAALAQQLRSHLNSVEQRCRLLESKGLTKLENEEYSFVANPEMEVVFKELSEAYKIQRHRLLELIFSPMKKARDFSNAFNIRNPKKSEDNNG